MILLVVYDDSYSYSIKEIEEMNEKEKEKEPEKTNSQHDFLLGTEFTPNHNIISYALHNNYTYGWDSSTLADIKISTDSQVFEPSFKNNSFADIMNYYENLVTCSQWDVRENGDYETIVLGRSNYFYNCLKYNWKQTGNFIDEIDKVLKEEDEIEYEHVDDVENTDFSNEDYVMFEDEYYIVKEKDKNKKQSSNELKKIKSKNNTQTPEEFLDDAINYQLNKNKTNTYVDLEARQENKKTDIFLNFEKNLFRKERRRIGENIFAISKINLISYDVKTNDVVNTLSTMVKKEKIGLTIINTNIEDLIVEKPIQNMFDSMGQKLGEDNLVIQGEYMATQLIKELELTYQGSVTILFNQDVEVGDYLNLIDDTASTYGVFKVMSYEHVLDKRGMITILKVCAAWDLRDPMLDVVCSNISYELMDEFRLKMAEDIDGSKSYLINKVFAYYLKSITHSVKYTNFRWIAIEKDNKLKTRMNKIDQLYFSPSIIPVRFFPMFRKGIIQMPVSLEKAFVFNDTVYIKYFESFQYFIAYQVPKFFKNLGRGMIKTLNYLGDIILGTLTFNLHESFKGSFGTTEKKAQTALLGEIIADSTEFRNTNYGEYNPYGRISGNVLGRDYDLTIGFFNVQLQSTMNLNNGSVMKSTGRAEKVIEFKENTVREKVVDVFDYTLMVEVYDGFNKDGVLGKYNYKDFIRNTTPNYYDGYIVGKIFENHHGAEYGAMFRNRKLNITNESKTIKSGVIEKLKYKNNNGEVEVREVERSFIETTFDLKSLNIGIKTLKVYWFHNFYGVSDSEVDDIEVRKKFINAIFAKMKQNMNKNTGCVLMGDCNLEIIDYNSSVIRHTGDSWANNYVYVIPQQYKELKSMIRNATTVDTKGETKNLFDNIVVTPNLVDEVNGDYFYFSEYNYPEDNKRDVSDHIPVYIGIKVN